MKDENLVLKKLIKTLLIDYVGTLCFLHNKSHEYPKSKYGSFVKNILSQKIKELDTYYKNIVSEEKEEMEIYKKLVKLLDVEVKEFN